jgi:hypothetical protein
MTKNEITSESIIANSDAERLRRWVGPADYDADAARLHRWTGAQAKHDVDPASAVAPVI